MSINQVPPSEWDRVFKRNPREFDKAPIGSSDPMSDFGEYAGPDSEASTWKTPDYTRNWEQRKRPDDVAPGIPLTLDEHTEMFKEEYTLTGGPSKYYDFTIPVDEVETINGFIKVKAGTVIRYALDNDFDKGNIFKAMMRIGKKPGVSFQYDRDKIHYFTDELREPE